MNICIRDPQTREWTTTVSSARNSRTCVTAAIRDAYANYKDRGRTDYYQETSQITGQYIVYRPDNDPYLPTYIACLVDIPYEVPNNWAGTIIISQEIHDTMIALPSSSVTPILDMNDISVFIIPQTGMSRANWLPSREYQAWAYRDFIYDEHHSIKKSYMSHNTSPIVYETNVNILANQIVTIPIVNIAPNIVFNISRNDNNSVYFERNDAVGSRVRICDHSQARAGYLGFYTRMTMDPGIVVIPPQYVNAYPHYGAVAAAAAAAYVLLPTAHIPAPEETDDEEHQCILCFRYRINAKFSPCKHTVCCSECYSKMTKNECPVCRAAILIVMNI